MKIKDKRQKIKDGLNTEHGTWNLEPGTGLNLWNRTSDNYRAGVRDVAS
jgi:hypothetical protein